MVYITIIYLFSEPEVNISLNEEWYLYPDIATNCTGVDRDFIEYSLTILKSDGEVEVYSLNFTNYEEGEYIHYSGIIVDSGLGYYGDCYFYDSLACIIDIFFHPTDLRYDGAEVSVQVYFPECFDALHMTNFTRLNIQGETQDRYT